MKKCLVNSIFDNCRFLELSENSRRAQKRHFVEDGVFDEV